MATIQLTIPHYVFLLTVLSIFIAIGFRRGVIIPALVGTFLIGMLSADAEVALLDQVVFGVQVLFNALLNAGAELFGIMAVIALMVSMLHALRAQGADQIMVAPMKKLMGSPMAAFFVLAATMYTAAAFFWPTPAVALVGTVLVPVAMRVGLPALAAAVAINLAGHGMALSADPIIQGATRLTAGAAGIDSQELLPYTVLFSLVTGITAISISVYTIRRDMKSGVLKAATAEEIEAMSEVEGHHDRDDASRGEVTPGKYARALAIGVPITLGCIAGLMIYRVFSIPTWQYVAVMQRLYLAERRRSCWCLRHLRSMAAKLSRVLPTICAVASSFPSRFLRRLSRSLDSFFWATRTMRQP